MSDNLSSGSLLIQLSQYTYVCLIMLKADQRIFVGGEFESWKTILLQGHKLTVLEVAHTNISEMLVYLWLSTYISGLYGQNFITQFHIICFKLL